MISRYVFKFLTFIVAMIIISYFILIKTKVQNGENYPINQNNSLNTFQNISNWFVKKLDPSKNFLLPRFKEKFVTKVQNGEKYSIYQNDSLNAVQNISNRLIEKLDAPQSLSLPSFKNKFDKSVIIGAGSGRSGTLSAASFLNSQINTSITHEMRGACSGMPWMDSYNETQFTNVATKIYNNLMRRSGHIVGDVASWYMPYLNYLMKYPNVKTLILKRDKNDTINSWINWLGHKRNHWITDLMRKTLGFRNDIYDKCFPTYHDLSPNITEREIISIYYDDYYKRAETIRSKYPERTIIIDTYQFLNSQKVQSQILSQLEFQTPYHYDKIITHPTQGKQMKKIMSLIQS